MDLLVVFDAPSILRRPFQMAGFRPYGRQPGAWAYGPLDPAGEEARDLIYELHGVGLRTTWRPYTSIKRATRARVPDQAASVNTENAIL